MITNSRIKQTIFKNHHQYPGYYVLMIRLPETETIPVGRLGTFDFQQGCYVYSGSALGPGGVRARLNRHLSTHKRLHWHIDYLLQKTEISGVIYLYQKDIISLPQEESVECTLNQSLSQLPGAAIVVPHFGASDCKSGCLAHLIYYGSISQKKVYQHLKVGFPAIRKISLEAKS